MTMNNQTKKALKKIFTWHTLDELLKTGKNKDFESLVYLPHTFTYGEVFSLGYGHLKTEYQNEYYLQNELLYHNMWLRQEPMTAYSQFHVGNSIADMVLIVEHGRYIVDTAYEIKSEFDTLHRLEKQLTSYLKCFSYVCIATPEKNAQKVKHELPNTTDEICDHVGVFKTENGVCYHSCTRNTQYDHETLFKLLHKKERERLYSEITPKPVDHYQHYLAIFKELPPQQAHDFVMECLLIRNKLTYKDILSIASEIRSLVYFSPLQRKSWGKRKDTIEAINALWETPYGEWKGI